MQGIGNFDVSTSQYASTVALDDDPGILIKGSEAMIWGWHIKNTTGAALYVQFVNAAALVDVTLGTTTPIFSIGVAASSISDVSFDIPVLFSAGICVYSTTTAAGATGAASDCVFFYS